MIRVGRVLGELNADDKDLLCEFTTESLNVWNQFKEPLTQNFLFFLSKENGISIDFGSDIYIPLST